MAYSRFYLAILFHAILFAVLTYLSIWARFQEHLRFTGIGFGMLAIASLAFLAFHVINHNRRIIRFLRDHTINEPYPRFKSTYRDRTFAMIEQELNRLARSYSQIKLEKEAQHQLTDFIVEHIDTAIFTMDENKDIQVSNRAAHEFFPGSPPRNLSTLRETYPELYQGIDAMKHRSTRMIPVHHDNELRQILVKANSFELKGGRTWVCSLDDITTEMLKAEDRNWQKLLRILRHEIINSVTPIISLSGSLIDTLEEQGLPEAIPENGLLNLDPFYRGLKAIDTRSKGLLSFVKSYKSLIEIPEPSIKTISLEPVFDHLYDLFHEDLEKDHIRLHVECADGLMLESNKELLIQVLVNLIRNAHESLLEASGDRVLSLQAERTSNFVRVRVSDTGPGIAPDILEEIFVPFFTTKEKGSGIGLSLSRQLIYRLGGTIGVKSTPEETEFSLQFAMS
jgi:nitrogen fixation/metabolism regulation signal transduction histidine kinase